MRREVVLVALAILFVLALIIPALHRQRAIQRRNVCEARQFRASLAVIQTSLDNERLPGYRLPQLGYGSDASEPTSWIFPILPYIHPIETDLISTLSSEYEGTADQSELTYRADSERLIGRRGPWSDVHKTYGLEGEGPERGSQPNVYIPELICPSNSPKFDQKRQAFNSLVANTGMPDSVASDSFPADWRSNGVFTDQFPGEFPLAPPTTLRFIEESDGLGNVIMLSENVDAGFWTDSSEASVGFVWTPDAETIGNRKLEPVWRLNMKPGQGTGTIVSARPSSNHAGGVNVAMCDGSTRFISDKIDPIAWSWMMMSDSSSPQYPGSDELLEAPYLSAQEEVLIESSGELDPQ